MHIWQEEVKIIVSCCSFHCGAETTSCQHDMMLLCKQSEVSDVWCQPQQKKTVLWWRHFEMFHMQSPCACTAFRTCFSINATAGIHKGFCVIFCWQLLLVLLIDYFFFPPILSMFSDSLLERVIKIKLHENKQFIKGKSLSNWVKKKMERRFHFSI